MTFIDPLRTTASVLLPGRLADALGRRAVQLTAEASVYTVLSFALPWLLNLGETGAISLFLVSAPLTDRLVVLLEENRTDIYTLHTGSRRANLRAATGLLSLFVGIAIGYAVVASWLGERATQREFAFAIEAANLRDEDFLHRSFGGVVAIFGNNVRVAIVVLCLGFVYRAYGGMLALAWNACIWAVVLTILAFRVQAGPIVRVLLAAGVVPHLAFEGCSYVLVALAAIFTSKALGTYDRHDARLWSVMRAATILTALAVAGLAVAAAYESWLLPRWIALITGQ